MLGKKNMLSQKCPLKFFIILLIRYCKYQVVYISLDMWVLEFSIIDAHIWFHES